MSSTTIKAVENYKQISNNLNKLQEIHPRELAGLFSEMKIHFREQYGTRGEEILYVTPADQKNIVRVPLKQDRIPFRERIRIVRFLKGVFLPKGYPDSVSEDYLVYQVWDTVQAFCSTISGTLTTHAILRGIGVGNNEITPLSATATWVLKEGTGHFGKILFAWWKGTELDIESKKWRLRADVLNDFAMGIEMYILPRFSVYSTYILCATTTLKAIVGVAGGATRAALTKHHAVRGNLADVASKDSAQETCVNLIASFAGLYLLSSVTNESVLHSIFILVTFLHIYANIKAVKSVCLKTFNESRYLITLEEFFRSNRMMTPKKVNELERVTLGRTVSVSLTIRIGLSAQSLVDYFKSSYEIENIVSSFDPQNKFMIAECSNYLGIYLHFDARPIDVLRAYFYAVSYLQDRSQVKERYWEVHDKWNEFLNMAQNEEWCISNHLLYVDEYRLDWKI